LEIQIVLNVHLIEDVKLKPELARALVALDEKGNGLFLFEKRCDGIKVAGLEVKRNGAFVCFRFTRWVRVDDILIVVDSSIAFLDKI
jgi:hypothetical protein